MTASDFASDFGTNAVARQEEQIEDDFIVRSVMLRATAASPTGRLS